MRILLHAGNWSDPGPVVAWTEVDPDDYEELAAYRWQVNAYGYAVRTSRKDIPAVCPECGWLPKAGIHAARSMASHRAKKHGRHSEGKRYTIHMHRQILGLKPGDLRQGDHKNRDRLDNRRANLRIVAGNLQVQNQVALKTFNGKPVESQHRGVYMVKKRGVWTGKWKAEVGGSYLGCFASEEDAAAAAAAHRLKTMEYALD